MNFGKIDILHLCRAVVFSFRSIPNMLTLFFSDVVIEFLIAVIHFYPDTVLQVLQLAKHILHLLMVREYSAILKGFRGTMLSALTYIVCLT